MSKRVVRNLYEIRIVHTAMEEPSMLKHGDCPNCNSSEIMRNVAVIDRPATSLPLTVGMYRDHEAWLNKELFQSPLKAWICGACRYTELFVQHPRELLQIYRDTQQDGR